MSAVKVNPGQVSPDHLLNNPVQPGKVTKQAPLAPKSQPSAPQAPSTPDVSGFKKFQGSGARMGGVFGHAAPRASASRITTAAGPKLSVGDAIDRVAEGLSNFGEAPLSARDLSVLNGALGVSQPQA